MTPTSQIAPQTTPPTRAHPPTASAAITGTTGKHHGRRVHAITVELNLVQPLVALRRLAHQLRELRRHEAGGEGQVCCARWARVVWCEREPCSWSACSNIKRCQGADRFKPYAAREPSIANSSAIRRSPAKPSTATQGHEQRAGSVG
jgi:hypothetical protein